MLSPGKLRIPSFVTARQRPPPRVALTRPRVALTRPRAAPTGNYQTARKLVRPGELVSICMATRNQAPLLEAVLQSILSQQHGFPLQIVVTDDGSSDGTAAMLAKYPVEYHRLENNTYRNGVYAKNVSLRAARGDVVIQQSSDVLHAGPDVIAQLLQSLRAGTIVFADVRDRDPASGRITRNGRYQRQLFFLGACWREDICKIGGYDEAFANVVWYDDDWHGKCLTAGLGLQSVYTAALALHQLHPSPQYDSAPARAIYRQKCAAGKYLQHSWPYRPGVAVQHVQARAS
jgi:glycosyltransferase involved in cell wall biosynthesis